MRLRTLLFPADDSIDPASLARLAEDAGFDSLFFPDHTHIPASRETPFPGGEPLGASTPRPRALRLPHRCGGGDDATPDRNGDLPRSQRDPIVTCEGGRESSTSSPAAASSSASARVERRGAANHGGTQDTAGRGSRTACEAMKEIWTQDEATYHGSFVDFDAIWSWPKPLQKPYPPIILSGNGPRVLDRVLAYADGWCPLPFPTSRSGWPSCVNARGGRDAMCRSRSMGWGRRPILPTSSCMARQALSAASTTSRPWGETSPNGWSRRFGP